MIARAAGTVVALTLVGCAPAPGVLPPPPPNVLVVVVDCLRWDRLQPDAPLPAATAMRALAAEGTSFDRAFAQGSWTRPSVATLLTGLYPSEHGLGAFGSRGPDTAGQALSPDVVTLAEGLRAAGYATALVADQWQFAPVFGLDQGFDFYHYRPARATRLNTLLREWVAGPERRPFFAYLHYLELHWPYCPRDLTRNSFERGGSAIDFCQHWRQLDRDIRAGRVVLGPADRAEMESRYDEDVFNLDVQLRTLFASLREDGLWDDTLVVLTSDHGEEFFERGSFGHGHHMHDELLHVPLVVKPPAAWRAPRGARLDLLVETRDLVATVLDAAGIGLSRDAGRSLLPWVRGEATAAAAAPLRDFVVAESNGMIAVRTLEWKLIVFPAEGREELYDLVADPGETRDVKTERPEALAVMREHLAAWRAGLRPATGKELELDPETEEGLRALGYLN